MDRLQPGGGQRGQRRGEREQQHARQAEIDDGSVVEGEEVAEILHQQWKLTATRYGEQDI